MNISIRRPRNLLGIAFVLSLIISSCSKKIDVKEFEPKFDEKSYSSSNVTVSYDQTRTGIYVTVLYANGATNEPLPGATVVVVGTNNGVVVDGQGEGHFPALSLPESGRFRAAHIGFVTLEANFTRPSMGAVNYQFVLMPEPEAF